MADFKCGLGESEDEILWHLQVGHENGVGGGM
jgi:hypothetical protein